MRHLTVNIDKVQTLKSACSQKKKTNRALQFRCSIHGVTPFMGSTEEEFERMYSGVLGGGVPVVEEGSV